MHIHFGIHLQKDSTIIHIKFWSREIKLEIIIRGPLGMALPLLQQNIYCQNNKCVYIYFFLHYVLSTIVIFAMAITIDIQ